MVTKKKKGLPKRERAQRAARARLALEDYKVKCGYDEALIDLLTDLRHFCEQRGFDFVELDETAGRHYRDER